ncbi:MAG TPA: peroxiredoxin family protein [Nocardioidaceae bacterium]|nr:peroxiredoxin family protein [Nocardioidaceae bacterium]
MTTTAVKNYEVGDRVEDFVLPDVDGNPIRLSGVAGTWTLLYFITTWCPYCTAEAPFLETELVAQFADRGLKLVVVDVKEPATLARTLPERFGWNAPFLVDESGDLSERFAPPKEGLPPEVAIINAHLLLDENLVIRFAEYLNMERFDVHATSVAASIAEVMAGEGR